ncbi:zinc finger (C3HC4-type RING finger) family protein [Trifolium repens]|nr:zinc finger (C3HC4-type RING finger) family protein [Trifolium repens]
MFFIWVFKQTSNPPSIDQLKQASDPPSIDQIKQTSDLPCIDHQLKQTPYLPRTDQLSCIDQLKEELLCAICLDICFKPSTTRCGHSFCRRCLLSAMKACGKKCPKCTQPLRIRDGRSLIVNTVLWNTIQLIFPQEIEARKAFLDSLNNQQAAQSQTSSSSTGARNLGTRNQWRQ